MVTFQYASYEPQGIVCFSGGNRTRKENLKEIFKIQCQDKKPEYKFDIQTQYVVEDIKRNLQKYCCLSTWP